MKKIAILTALAAALFYSEAALAVSLNDITAKHIKKGISAKNEHIKNFYKRREYAPAWSGERGLLPAVETLLSVVRDSREEGLDPEHYGLSRIETEMQKISETPEPSLLAGFDVMLTDAFISYCSDLYQGRFPPEDGLKMDKKDIDYARYLQSALKGCTKKRCAIKETMEKFVSPLSDYARLRESLKALRQQSDWPYVPEGPMLKRGNRGERVFDLCGRLMASGDLGWEAECQSYDKVVEEGVKNFQRRHGLRPDGVAGPMTVAAMNIPLQWRIRQMEINMERMRWFPRRFPNRYISVNTADFSLRVIEGGDEVFGMNVIVGKPFWETPAVGAKMTYIVLNPSWKVPKNIAFDEILPKAKRDPSYIKRDGLRLMTSEGELDPSRVNWSKVNEDNLYFDFLKDPGPSNPLGRMKFMFPNIHAVYLHDTPEKGLFSKDVRAFSHGCIRLERPEELAEHLLGWDRDSLLLALNEGYEIKVPLPEPIDVFIYYLTAWVDEDGTVNFRDDIYGRDTALGAALGEGR